MLMIELPPDLEEQLQAEAARQGQNPSELARSILERELAGGCGGRTPAERARRIATLMEQWDAEDAADPDSDPVWEIPRITLTGTPNDRSGY